MTQPVSFFRRVTIVLELYRRKWQGGNIYSLFSRLSQGSDTGLVTVGPAKVRACKFIFYLTHILKCYGQLLFEVKQENTFGSIFLCFIPLRAKRVGR